MTTQSSKTKIACPDCTHEDGTSRMTNLKGRCPRCHGTEVQMVPPECRNCAYWAFDMDMEPFCVHPNANSFGTDINRMRGTERTKNMRGEPCGPEGKFFEITKRREVVL